MSREFWILDNGIDASYPFYDTTICIKKPDPTQEDEADFENCIHVIDFASYQKLLTENSLLKQDCDIIKTAAKNEIEKQLKIYLSFIEKYNKLADVNVELKSQLTKLRQEVKDKTEALNKLNHPTRD